MLTGICTAIAALVSLTPALSADRFERIPGKNIDFYGVHCGNDTDVEKAIPVLRDLGGRWVRLWCNVHWDERTEHRSFQAARDFKKAGFQVILLLNHHGGDQPLPDYATVRRYCDWIQAVDGMRQAVDVWEICNELNLPKYWPGAPQQYVEQVLKAAWDSFHARGELVLGGSFTAWQEGEYGVSVTAEYVDAGYNNYCDFAGFHPYTDRPRAMADVMHRAADLFADKPIIVTEWNLKQTRDLMEWASRLDESRRLMAENDRIRTICHYRLVGFSSEGGWPGLVTATQDGYVPKQPFYDLYKTWPKGRARDDGAPPPQAPREVTAMADGPDRAKIAWLAASGGMTTLGYRIYRDGNWLGQTRDRSFTDPGPLEPSKVYHYRVSAYDSEGRLSSPSRPVELQMPKSAVIRAEADAYVSNRAGEQDKNFGGSYVMYLKGAAGYERYGYVRFPLSGSDLPDHSEVILRLGCYSLKKNGAADVEVRIADDNPWVDASITWKNRPRVGDRAAPCQQFRQASTTYRYDVTSCVRDSLEAGADSICFCIIAPKGDFIGVATREHQRNTQLQPVLIILSSKE